MCWKLATALAKPYRGPKRLLNRYWHAYGGWRAVLTSGYAHVSAILAALIVPVWIYQEWWEIVLGVIPNVLCFSLGGYAILLAFGDRGFHKEWMGAKKKAHSPFMALNAAFVHFILLQIGAMLLAVSAQVIFGYWPYSPPYAVVSVFGIFAFVYAIAAAMAATLHLLSFATIYERYTRARFKEEQRKSEQNPSDEALDKTHPPNR